MAAVAAGRALRANGASGSIVALDGARTLGAKILVAGGGRCNVTHWRVTEAEYAVNRPAVRSVLRRFGADETVNFFNDLGVELKREETGKLFPVTDSARTVLNALLRAVDDVGASIVHPARVTGINRGAQGFTISGEWGSMRATRVILATGGMALPRSGSDGAGYEFAKSLGHSLTPAIRPALVPLTLPSGHWITELSGLTVHAELVLRGPTGKRLVHFANSTLCTHFGLSGPSVLDISRYLLDARDREPGTTLILNWMPGESADATDAWLLASKGRGLLGVLRERLPERLSRAILTQARLAHDATVQQTPRESRRTLVELLVATELPIQGDRGFTYAEVTAGGVPIDEVDLGTMESLTCPGLSLCGEVLDVDGRIGGFNFQWAWATGWIAGQAAARAIAPIAESNN
ncbi:MAG: aminoacetone oxidase family FAD-binding enzyme [Phycisphaerae bacterium]|nr:aminoacetone oxidase family FAD-binding enzyme [Phycisphaerae bacterium]